MNRVDIERCESIIALMNQIFSLDNPESLVFLGVRISPSVEKIRTDEPGVSSGNLITREWVAEEYCFRYYLAVRGVPRLSLHFYTQKRERGEHIALVRGTVEELEELNGVLQTMYQKFKSNRARTLDLISTLLKGARSLS